MVKSSSMIMLLQIFMFCEFCLAKVDLGFCMTCPGISVFFPYVMERVIVRSFCCFITIFGVKCWNEL